MNKYDFSGYATKINVRCTDGRTIRKDAFKQNDGQTVPLVWQHMHSDPGNVLGHALLENRDDGVYAYCKLNETSKGKDAKILVEHGDISSLSIFANELKQQGGNVTHGMIREVSLVLAGANIEACIDNVTIQHSDGSFDTDDEEALIYMAEPLTMDDVAHSAEPPEAIAHADNGDKTMLDIFNTMNEDQKNVVYATLAHAVGGEAPEDDEAEEDQAMEHSDKGGTEMNHNIFDKASAPAIERATLTHDQLTTIVQTAQKCGSFKDAFLAHAGDYGIDNIDVLFPDAKSMTSSPDFISRRMEWVSGVLSGTHHTPFSRIKSITADITADEARAKGYIKGNQKTEEVFPLLKRVTIPTTIYKKQKLDREDIIDITELDVVAWLKAEMRLMLDEEIARAILIGDGRAADDPDKINETNIRPIYKEDDLYAVKVAPLAADATAEDMIEAIIRSRKDYKGSGNPAFYTTTDVLADMLLVKDTTGRRLYNTEAELISVLRVSKIVEVEVMEGVTRQTTDTTPVTLALQGILVNLKDYNVGADKGGNVSMFDDFDIDYNQYKYLIETRISGALTKPHSALILEKTVAAG